MERIHVGVNVAYLEQGIREGRFPPSTVIRDGRPFRTKAQALTQLGLLSAEGVTTLSGCPNPLPDGHCPGHRS